MAPTQPKIEYNIGAITKLLFGADNKTTEDGVVHMVARTPTGQMRTIARMTPADLAAWLETSFYLAPDADYYITKALYKSEKNRRTTNVKAFSFVAVELDAHFADFDAVELKRRAEGLVDVVRNGPVADGLLPDPNLAIYSGRGVHLVWRIDTLGGTEIDTVRAAARKFGQIIEREVAYHPYFSAFTLDSGYANNPTGLMRMPGTINSNTQTAVTCDFFHAFRVNLKTEEETEIPTIQPSTAIDTGLADDESTKRTGRARMRALKNLVAIRGAACLGNRDVMTLIYYCAAIMAGYTLDQCDALALNFNRCLTSPRAKKEVLTSLSTAKKAKYKFSDKRIIELLEITDQELAAIGWNPYTGAHKKRDTARAAARAARIEKVLEMYKSGQSISAISAITGHSRNSIHKWIGLASDTADSKNTEVDKNETEDISLESASDCSEMGAIYVFYYYYYSRQLEKIGVLRRVPYDLAGAAGAAKPRTYMPP